MPMPQAAERFGESSWFLTPVLNFRDVFAQASENVLVFSIAQLPLDFGQSEMNDVVMMNFFSRQSSASSSHILCSRSISFGVIRGACGPR